MSKETMIQKWVDALPEHTFITDFIDWLNSQENYREQRVIDIHAEKVADLYLGIDRVQLDDERRALLASLAKSTQLPEKKSRKTSAEMLRVLRHMASTQAILSYKMGMISFEGAYAHAPSISTVDALRMRGLLHLNGTCREATWTITDAGREALS